MQQQSITLVRGKESVLKKIPVESFPVVTDKKLSAKKVVGDFSLIPTTAIDQIGLIGSIKLREIRIPVTTKSAKKGWRLIAKW